MRGFQNNYPLPTAQIFWEEERHNGEVEMNTNDDGAEKT